MQEKNIWREKLRNLNGSRIDKIEVIKKENDMSSFSKRHRKITIDKQYFIRNLLSTIFYFMNKLGLFFEEKKC